ncbi:hypothetical protein CBM2589_B120109 [Cupriavidus taiwanensis]|uniref:Uncharacterized protein n=1 Tax=Cupriavidus taiwanensis TaxID=164546 RepID=A0A975WTX6_9BURK|nr:hypothetical protein CBM2589_B120109 [Cupriavidus taiwanensis]
MEPRKTSVLPGFFVWTAGIQDPDPGTHFSMGYLRYRF